MKPKNAVVCSRAPDMDYRTDYVALPKNYGSRAYYEREDVRAIIETVFENLKELDSRVPFIERVKGRKVLIKPNFVGVYHRCGYSVDDFPNSTDPRVIDAVVMFFKQFTDKIVLIEGSGPPVTRLMAMMNGTDRLVKHHHIEFLAVEEQPIDHYILPKAQVMQDVYIPRPFSEVVRGETFYISLPKMKTNAYTQVTLGFKNAMGCLSTHMRYRNHNYNIEKKLVDLLYLFKPDLTIIDGIIGAEGNVPGPVDPVDAHIIISGTNSVETDRVATRFMSHNPAKVRLMIEADRLGFNDPEVEIINEQAPIPWRPADTSVISGNIPEYFPNIRFLVGASKNSAPKLNSPDEITLEKLQAMEQACPGGCLASLIFMVENYRYMKGYSPEDIQRLNVVLGGGAKIGEEYYYFDKNLKPYTREEIKKLPGRTVAAGACTKWMANDTEYFVDGCMAHVIKLSSALDAAAKKKNPLSSVLVKKPYTLFAVLQTVLRRRSLALQGNRMDVELCTEDRIFKTRPLTEEERTRDWVFCPAEPVDKGQIQRQVKNIMNPIPTYREK